MDPRLRFKADRPCQVCGGHANLPQGKGRRCYGFISDDGLYAHCTREEFAGRLDRNRNSDTYAHYLKGACHCGKSHGVGPARDGILPRGSQGAPSVHSYRHPQLGQPVQVWAYRYADGELAGYVARWDRPDGGKEFRPLVLEGGRWQPKGIPEPRPLYNLPELLARPDAPIMVLEGEKTCNAGKELFPAYVVVHVDERGDGSPSDRLESVWKAAMWWACPTTTSMASDMSGRLRRWPSMKVR